MAEIRVEQKRGSLAWLWILLVLLLVALGVWYFMGMPGVNDAGAAGDSTAVPGATTPIDSVAYPLHPQSPSVVYRRA
ncbi:MAG TPA: hypothetical protein VFS08_12360 [Gemmatimonadaceae bacterium]|nr:hypothetical protein [Gemmatimonadaceae bacterium]